MASEEHSLGDFLRDARGKRSKFNVTQSGGPGSGNLAQYELGRRLPNIETLQWLCNFYGADIKEAIRLLEQDRVARDMKRAGIAA